MTTQKQILITGGAGFIGINTADYLLGRGYEVTVLTIFPAAVLTKICIG